MGNGKMYKKILLITLFAVIAINIVNCDDENESPLESFAEDSESYITKEAAAELSQRIRNSKSRDQEDEEYDDLLQKLVTKPKPKHKKMHYYEKKYFDYLPSEDSVSSDQSQEKHKYPKKASIPVSKQEDETEDEFSTRPHKRINSRRFKRDTQNVQQSGKMKTKRFIEYQSVPYVQIYSPVPNAHLYAPQTQTNYNPYPQQSQIIPRRDFAPSVARQQFYGPPTRYNAYPAYLMYNLVPQSTDNRNIWYNDGQNSNQFHPPYNFYLPVAPSVPPQTNDGNAQGIDLDNRFIMGSDPDSDLTNQLIFDRDYTRKKYPTRNPNSIPRPRPYTTRPPTTTTPADSPSFSLDSDADFDWDNFQNNLTKNRPSLNNSNRRPSQQDLQTTTTPRSSPSFSHGSDNDDNFDWDSLRGGRRDPVTETPPVQTDVKPPPPSRCIFAIVTCCSRRNNQIRYSCFERFGCEGAFWDFNPCTPATIDAAANEIEHYSSY